MGRVQLGRLPALNAARHEVARHYHQALSGETDIRLPELRAVGESSHQMFVIGVPAERRDSVVRHLQDRGVGASVHFDPPVHEQSAYRSLEPGLQLKNTVMLARTSITLPISPVQTPDQTDYVATCLTEALAQ